MLENVTEALTAPSAVGANVAVKFTEELGPIVAGKVGSVSVKAALPLI